MNTETPSWTTLVDVDSLGEALGNEDLVLLDCRAVLTDPPAGCLLYTSRCV